MYEVLSLATCNNIRCLQERVEWGCADPIRDKVIKIGFSFKIFGINICLWKRYYVWDDELQEYAQV